MFGHGKRMVQFNNSPKSRVGMRVWSQAIGVHIKMSIANLVIGCKGHVIFQSLKANGPMKH
jgi:hypothetical protein